MSLVGLPGSGDHENTSRSSNVGLMLGHRLRFLGAGNTFVQKPGFRHTIDSVSLTLACKVFFFPFGRTSIAPLVSRFPGPCFAHVGIPVRGHPALTWDNRQRAIRRDLRGICDLNGTPPARTIQVIVKAPRLHCQICTTSFLTRWSGPANTRYLASLGQHWVKAAC